MKTSCMHGRTIHWGQTRPLPHRNIAVPFSANSRHHQERPSTPHVAGRNESGCGEEILRIRARAQACRLPSLEGAGMAYTSSHASSAASPHGNSESSTGSPVCDGGTLYYIAISITYVFAVLF